MFVFCCALPKAKSKISAVVVVAAAVIAVVAVGAAAAGSGDASYRWQLQMLIGNYDRVFEMERTSFNYRIVGSFNCLFLILYLFSFVVAMTAAWNSRVARLDKIAH